MKLESAVGWAQIAQAAAAVGAVVTAAWWFLEQREMYPRANLTQSVDVVRIADDLISVEVTANLRNDGRKIIKLSRARVKLQVVSEQPFNYSGLAEQSGSAYWNAFRGSGTPDDRQFNIGELRWPVMKTFDGNIDHHVEPGETDSLIFTFLIPCTALVDGRHKEIPMIRVSTDVLKPDKEHGEEFAWKSRSFIDVSTACKG